MTATRTKYTATFADGTVITRTTVREYGVAWRATWVSDDGAACSETGFAVSKEKAVPYKPAKFWAHRGMSAQRKAAGAKLNAEFLARSGYAIEFAPAVAA